MSPEPHARNGTSPGVASRNRVILVDGVCRLCNGWSRFVIRHDRRRRFRLASMQSDAGQAILQYFDQPTQHFDTLLYVEGTRAYEKSDAILRIVTQFGGSWALCGVLRIVPRPVRDGLYDLIARYRYRLFGRYDVCTLPRADHAQRFLDGDA